MRVPKYERVEVPDGQQGSRQVPDVCSMYDDNATTALRLFTGSLGRLRASIHDSMTERGHWTLDNVFQSQWLAENFRQATAAVS